MHHSRPLRLASTAVALSAAVAACSPVSLATPPSLHARGPGVPRVQVQVEERFYPVSGRSAASLNLSLVLHGPRRSGRAAHALTEWRIRWSYVPLRRHASACVSARPRVEVEIVTTLPLWMDQEDAPPALAGDWVLFLDRLRDHEAGHQRLALRGANELASLLGALEAADCDRLMEEAERAVALLASNHEARHRRFDRDSDYGLRPIDP